MRQSVRFNLPNQLFSKQAPDDPPPPIVCAAQAPNIITAAFRYAASGMSVLPLRGKHPALRTWKPYQTKAASLSTLRAWVSAGLFQNVGIVCGATSDNLVVVDLDTEAAYTAFIERFPQLSHTFTVLTGSGAGYHLYLRPALLPLPVRALRTSFGNVELLSTRQQVVAPPSCHPETGKRYQIYQPLNILSIPNLDDVTEWIRDLIRGQLERKKGNPIQQPNYQSTYHNPALFEAIARHFIAAGYRSNGDWLNGPCIYPERHQHDDSKPSFGFNRRSGYGWCFVCGSMLAREIAKATSILEQPCVGSYEAQASPALFRKPDL